MCMCVGERECVCEPVCVREGVRKRGRYFFSLEIINPLFKDLLLGLFLATCCAMRCVMVQLRQPIHWRSL